MRTRALHRPIHCRHETHQIEEVADEAASIQVVIAQRHGRGRSFSVASVEALPLRQRQAAVKPEGIAVAVRGGHGLHVGSVAVNVIREVLGPQLPAVDDGIHCELVRALHRQPSLQAASRVRLRALIKAF